MKILLVEDNEDDKLILEHALLMGSAANSHLTGVTLDWEDTFAAGKAAAETGNYDVILLDLSLPDSFGVESVSKAQMWSGKPALIVFTGNLEADVGIDCVREGADDYLIKGQYDENLLGRAILHAIERRKTKNALAHSQAQLLEAKLAAESANDSKTVFLAMMSHEFRTPLQNLLGFLDLLTETELDEEQKEYVEIAMSNVGKLDVLIEDIVDYSKVEKGTMNITNVLFVPEETLREAINIIERKREGKETSIIINLKTPLDGVLLGDSGRLLQILNNLLSNAFKYTPSDGTISITVDARDEGNEKRLYFTVADTGRGISESAIKGIFSPFKQANPEADQSLGGTGLGLAICKRLCHMMGGQHQDRQPGRHWHYGAI